MKTVKISEDRFKILMNATKNIVCKDESRPILKYILLKFNAEKLTAYAVDGCRASKVVLELEDPVDEPFECLIKPIKVRGRRSSDVTIEFDGTKTAVYVQEEYGEIKYIFNKPTDEFIDIEKVYEMSEQHDLKLYFNADFLAEACKAIENHSTKCVTLQISNDPAKSLIVTGEDKMNHIQFEELILPMKITEID